MWSKKPLARRRKRPIKFRGHAVRIPEQKIGSPLRSVSGNIHYREPRRLSRRDVLALRSVDLKPWLQRWWPIALLMKQNHQPCLAIPHLQPISGGIELPNSRQPRQKLIELGEFKWLSNKRPQETLDWLFRFWLYSLRFHELWNRNLALLPLLALTQIVPPRPLIQRKRR